MFCLYRMSLYSNSAACVLSSVKRDLLQCQKRPTSVKRMSLYSNSAACVLCIKMSKETYYSVKRDLL
jgi:hypothetical protein